MCAPQEAGEDKLKNWQQMEMLRIKHAPAPLAALTSETTKWKWEPQNQKTFAMAKRIIAKETPQACPNFNKPFQIHTDASQCQLGAAVSQEGKLTAFHGRKLNPAQTRCTTAEREPLTTAQTLKECGNMLLGQQIEVFTDHKNPVCKHFNAERVVRWRLLLEEFGPELTHVKGTNNVVADALSRLKMAGEALSAKAFANELANGEEDFPTGCPFSHEEMEFRQKKDRAPQNKFRTQPELHVEKPRAFSDGTCELIAENNKICVPKSLQHKCAEWHHLTLMHPGEQRLELTTAQRHTWIGLQPACVRVCNNCENWAASKERDQKTGLLPPEPAREIIVWHTPCVDPAGPCKFGEGKKPETHTELHCVTMADPATGSVKRPPMQWPTGWKSTGLPDIHGLQKQPWTREENSPEKSARLLKTNMALNGRLLPVVIHNQTP